eukprot:CAMPEP_0176345234 /NCGR_PEP_ID=MMETSP0126-20121128/5298_1 /TAXON_ID=141414 ORGANISM="Strombidinopsis acuminatum, Strain SPMC142" /NCGR_SAMPLE_ID=MMETSP0126 /ASSEMBLY_ACC=CAM_ASM_000229 /LENGTH=38 /DNA_ID= /DNA_START= /DNA_END= /DNA_ORIENTATION=
MTVTKTKLKMIPRISLKVANKMKKKRTHMQNGKQHDKI